MSDHVWDSRFMLKAKLLATFSKDPSTKVGACIAIGKRGVSEGFNGFPAGVADIPARMTDRPTRLKLTMHAEVNAILFAKRDLAGATLYTTFIPCAACAAMIVQSGITRVVTLHPPPAFAERWADDIALTKMMFSEAGVTLAFIPEPKFPEETP